MRLIIPKTFLFLITLHYSCSEEKVSQPEIVTTVVTSITATTANSGGKIISEGGTSVIARGVCWSTNSDPTVTDSKTTDGIGAGDFSSSITGLIPNTTYYIRAYATNEIGTSYGASYSIKTNDGIINLSTNQASEIKSTSAISGGIIMSDGGAEIATAGICWSKNQNPSVLESKTIDAIINGKFTSTLSNLSSNTIFYIRAYATNKTGTFYGNQIILITPPIYNSGSGAIDIDGNNYSSMIIGTQEWLTSNLKTTRYVNGDLISNVTTSTNWESATSGAWSNYGNDFQNDNVYGKLYNWSAVIDSRKLCPSGWHVPSDAEWTDLIDYLGGYAAAPNKMKSSSNLWQINTGASNESGFSALPGGFRWYIGDFHDLGVSTGWWSATEKSDTEAWQRYLVSTSQENLVYRGGNTKNYGYSCRCIKD